MPEVSNYLIIGGSRGIGGALAGQLARAGNQVTATYFKNKPDTDTGNVDFHPFDVLDVAALTDFFPKKLTGLIYCPGSINLRPFDRIKPEDFVKDYELQVIGAIRCIQAALPALKQEAGSSILLFSTVAVQTGLAYHTQVGSSKGAIEGLTRSLAAELSPAIRVNCIAPSLTDTPLAEGLLNTTQKREANAQRHPLKRIGSPEDLANMAMFLVTEKASWITGQILKVDGGMSAIRSV